MDLLFRIAQPEGVEGTLRVSGCILGVDRDEDESRHATTLKKDNTLHEKVKELAGDKKLLDSEFNRLVDYAEKNIVKESTVAKEKENKPHNRYVDIGRNCTFAATKAVLAVPFDDNYITLASEIFQSEDETSYINASRIVFTGCSQTFIAAQAPKPISFNHFWHMVVEQKVETSLIPR
jgi:protein tyrosine phosphatase